MDLYLTLWIGVAILTTVAIVAFKLFRHQYATSVSCWFCGEKCEIPYDQSNSWDCPHCEQYNGFTEDGDYNKPIPTQFCEELNISSISRSSALHSIGSGRKAANVLCDSCSRNQFMKIKQLANFVPLDEGNFDLEAEAYHHHLEQVYRLCRVCEVNVSRELARQNASICAKVKEVGITQTLQRHQGALDDSQASCHDVVAKSHSVQVAGILQLVSTASALALLITSCDVAFTRFLRLNLHSMVPLFLESCLEMLTDRIVLLLITGTFARILAVYISGLNRLQNIDAFNCFSWLMLLLLFFMLEDSHIYSRSLLILRLILSSINLILSMFAALGRSCCSRNIVQVAQISFRVEQQNGDLGQLSDLEQEGTNPEAQSVAECHNETTDVPYGKMRMLRLGTPKPKAKRKDSSFQLFGNVNYGNVAMDMPSVELYQGSGVGESYPLLSPARFCPSPASIPQKQFYPNALQRHAIKKSGYSMIESNGRIPEERINGLIHRKTVQTTTQNDGIPLSGETPKRRGLFGNGLLLRVVLGFSLVVNLIVVLCVFLKFQSVLSIELHNIHHVVKTFLNDTLFS